MNFQEKQSYIPLFQKQENHIEESQHLPGCKTWKNVPGLVLALALLAVFCGSCGEKAQDINILTDREIHEGWELVFDGVTLNGWRGLNMDHAPDKHWVVENGLLRKIPRDSILTEPNEGRPPRIDLLLDRPLQNFELAFEWKIGKGGNSGIKYNVLEELSAVDGRPQLALGFEYQILDDESYPQIEEYPSWASAGLYDLVEPEIESRLNPAGEWNSGRILFNGNLGEHWLNDELVLRFVMDSEKMNSSLAASKWNEIDDFGKRHDRAFIVLQYHTGSVWFRNMKLRELP
jgi:hypothetical protein